MGKKRNYTIYALGTRGSRPTHGKDFEIFGGQTSCFIVKSGKHAVVIDCGTGLYDAEEILRDCDVIDIVFTHVHYDHVLGLLDFSIFPKDARINFIGTFRSWLSYDTIEEFYKHPFWPVQPKIGLLCEVTNDGHEYSLADGIVLQVYDSGHPDNGNMIVLTLDGKKVSFMFDIELSKEFNAEVIKDSKFLFFDGMFDDSEYFDYVGWGHSTYQDGCRLANLYRCDELLIIHHHPKNNDKKLLELESKAKLIYKKTRFCRAGDIFVVD